MAEGRGNFESFIDWFVAVKSPAAIYQEHATYLLAELLFIFMALLNLRHALRHGGRLPYLWLATLFHGWTVESISYFVPDIDNFWHAQSMVIFLGKRLPLHIMLAYPVFLYTASLAVSKLHLKPWAEPFAVGLAVVLIDVPFDIMGIKLLWWTWHDTDPNIFDRHYWVPWTSYYFHASFACSFTFIFHGTRKLIGNKSDVYKSSGFLKEMLCAIVTGLFSMPLGIIQFIPIYHTLHDGYSIHTEVCVLILIAVYTMIIWTSDRNPSEEARQQIRKPGKTQWLDEISINVIVHYLVYIVLVLVAKPENIVRTGLNEEIGPCNRSSPVQTASGQVLSKKTFLCPTNYDEGYFDFHCLPNGQPPPDGSLWYTVCGVPYANHMEYIVVVCFFCLLGLYIFSQILTRSGLSPFISVKTKTKSKTK